MSFNPDKNKQAQEVVFSRKNLNQNILNYHLIRHLLLIHPLKSTLG